MKRLRVLVAEDHDLMRNSIVELLCREFQVVGAVCNGEELIQSASCLLPDVIVSDLLVPKLDGLEARNKLISQQRLVCPFVFVSLEDPDVVQTLAHNSPVAF